MSYVSEKSAINQTTGDNNHHPLIVAVDGPAGSGKSSVCAKACEKMGWSYLNTGAIYRAIAYLAGVQGVDLNNESEILKIVEQLKQDFLWDSSNNKLRYQGKSLGPQIYNEKVGKLASEIAKFERVRQQLVPIQRDLIYSSKKTILVEGRDIGTVIVPECPLKIFMTASLEMRAKRRLNQLRESGKITPEDSAEKIKAQIEQRDDQDQKRAFAPLTMASDAVLFDTSLMDQDQAIQKLITLIQDSEQKFRTNS